MALQGRKQASLVVEVMLMHTPYVRTVLLVMPESCVLLQQRDPWMRFRVVQNFQAATFWNIIK